jgi:hypothetical protein
MAGTTGLEPATSAVTGQRSNQTELRPQKQVLTAEMRRPFEGEAEASLAFFRGARRHWTRVLAAATVLSVTERMKIVGRGKRPADRPKIRLCSLVYACTAAGTQVALRVARFDAT